jgi:cinnamoyl-CoA reductase
VIAVRQHNPAFVPQNGKVLPFLQSLTESASSELTKKFLHKVLTEDGDRILGKGPVCVTGANGYLGSHIVLQLLEKGYNVHGTVRSLHDGSKFDHLLKLPHASSNLKLFECNLLGGQKPFMDAMLQCTTVIHTASPFFSSEGLDGQKELIEPAVQGTHNVLQAVLDSSSVQRVVLTSSTAAVYIDEQSSDHVYDEDDWSDLEYVRKNSNMHYAESKVLAERAAWGLIGPVIAEGSRQLDLVVIAPTLIIGPMLQSSLNTSCKIILAMLDGSMTALPNSSRCMVDVRDVAAMHIKAMLDPTATGRYIAIADCIPNTAIAKCIAGALPDSLTQGLPREVAPGSSLAAPKFWSKEKAYQLKQSFRPIEHSVADTAISLFLKGHMNDFLPAAVQHMPELQSATAAGAAAEA